MATRDPIPDTPSVYSIECTIGICNQGVFVEEKETSIFHVKVPQKLTHGASNWADLTDQSTTDRCMKSLDIIASDNSVFGGCEHS
jgi:hypothetical protein